MNWGKTKIIKIKIMKLFKCIEIYYPHYTKVILYSKTRLKEL